MRVLLWIRSNAKYDWRNQPCTVARIPAVGEYVAPEPDSPWYLVQLVVHTPGTADQDAEVYAMEMNREHAKLGAFRSTA